MRALHLPILTLTILAACSPKRIDEEPILDNGDRVPDPDVVAATATGTAPGDAMTAAAERDSIAAEALTDCSPTVCDALARGEVALGMNRTQVLAATRTTPAAWSIRGAEGAAVMVPASWTSPPRDAVADIAMVQLHDGGVSRYSYREAQGMRLVAAPEDATMAGRSDALARMLIREGDELVAVGRFDAALDRYDRADVLRPGDSMLDYKIAVVLDKQLRPIEALIRYKLFLHRLELERIEAVGDAYAKLADAIAHARERVIVLERRTR